MALLSIVLLLAAATFSELDSTYATSTRMTTAIRRTLGIEK